MFPEVETILQLMWSPPMSRLFRLLSAAAAVVFVSAPYGADFGYAPGYGYGYAPALGAGYMAPYGYGGYGYSAFGYTPPMYSAAYTVAYDYWALARPLPTAVVSPAGSISTMPTGN